MRIALEVVSSKYTTAIRWTDLDEKVNPFEDMDCFTAVLSKFYWRVVNCFESALKSRKLERLDWNKKGDRKTLVDIVLHYFGHGQSNVNILLYSINFRAVCQA